MRGGSPDPSTRDSRARQLRDEVKSGGNQPTHIRVIHRRPSVARGLNLNPIAPRPVDFVDESCGPARALRAMWTAPGQRWRVAHRLPTFACLSPTNSTGPTTRIVT
jgi:hypothetical protein